jgi:hypothetical protein
MWEGEGGHKKAKLRQEAAPRQVVIRALAKAGVEIEGTTIKLVGKPQR